MAAHSIALGHESRWGLTAATLAGLAAGALSSLAAPKYSLAIILAAVLAPISWYAFCIPGAWIRCFLVTAALLPPLPVGIGDSGPHFAVFFAAIGILRAMAGGAAWNVRPSFLSLALFGYFGTAAISIGPALMFSGTLIAAGSVTRIMLFGAALLVFFTASQGPDQEPDSRTRGTARLLFATAVCAAAFACIDFLMQFPAPAGYGPQFVWLDSGVYRRAQGLFYEASTLGNFCALFLAMGAAAILEPKDRRLLPRTWICIGSIVLTAALLASYSRASVLNVAVGIGVLMILERKRWFSARKLAAVAGFAVVTAVVLWRAAPEFAAGYWARVSFTLTDLASRPDRVLSGRLASWEILTGFAVDHPWQWVLGIGYKTLAYTGHFGHRVIADNAYLSTFIETGVIGLAALVLLNIAILVAAWKSAKGPTPFFGRWMLCFWAGEMVQMLSGDILTYWRVLPFCFWALAQAVRYSDHADTRP